MQTNIVIPCAGRGKRFADAGYNVPKPFVNVNGKTMLAKVIENLPWENANRIFIILLKDHEEYFRNIGKYAVTPIFVNGVTEGAACTVMTALKLIPEDESVLVANSDQWIDWSPEHFSKFVWRENCDGAIPTFNATHPKWSFAHVREDGEITGVVEKIPVSHHATCGVYYYRRCGDIVGAIDSMVSKNLRVNGEFYLAPAYNEMILEGKRIINYPVPKMYGMGTPEDLKETLDSGIFGGTFTSERHD